MQLRWRHYERNRMKGKFLKWIYIKEVYSEDETLIVNILGEVKNNTADAKIVYSSLEDFFVNQELNADDLNDSEVWEDVTPHVGDEFISIIDWVWGRHDDLKRVIWIGDTRKYQSLQIEFECGEKLSFEDFFKKYMPVDANCGQGYTEGYLAGRTGLRWL
jgi:hypothetical protein